MNINRIGKSHAFNFAQSIGNNQTANKFLQTFNTNYYEHITKQSQSDWSPWRCT